MRRIHIPESVPPLTAILAAVAVFVAVMLATPPGFGGLRALDPGAPRGPQAYAAAYALGAAAGLGFITLVSVAALVVALRALLAWRAQRPTHPVPTDRLKPSDFPPPSP
jgi:hypothetical protein